MLQIPLRRSTALGALCSVGGLFLSVLLCFSVVHAIKKYRWAQVALAERDSTIGKIETLAKRGSEYLVGYSYSVQGKTFTAEHALSASLFRSLGVGMQLEIGFVPAEPTISIPQVVAAAEKIDISEARRSTAWVRVVVYGIAELLSIFLTALGLALFVRDFHSAARWIDSTIGKGVVKARDILLFAMVATLVCAITLGLKMTDSTNAPHSNLSAP